ncbi:zinc finger protein 488, partial [Mustela nigripes]|uniref:zinc finger protein 488 n=1 Tax=Mustela nigripes TaxID=77151 RepID=UPI0028163886
GRAPGVRAPGSHSRVVRSDLEAVAAASASPAPSAAEKPRVLWSKRGWCSQGELSSLRAPPWAKPSRTPAPPKTNSCWGLYLRQPAHTLLVNMAAGKGAVWSSSAENRWRLSEADQGKGCKPVLLEKTNHLDSEAAPGSGGQHEACAELVPSATPGRLRLGRPTSQKVCWGQGQSAFTEVPRLNKRLVGVQAKEREHDNPAGQRDSQQLTQDIPRDPAGSKVFSVWPSEARGEQRSAFSKPARCPTGRPGPTSIFQAGGPADVLGELLGLINTVDVPCWGQVSNSKFLVGDFWHLQMLPQNAPVWSALVGAPTLWQKHAMGQMPMPSSSSSSASWALLPPTFTSLGLSTQNWCAKCNLSFRLTSDLVFHMRSHHKKEHARPDLHSKKLREEALTCPICHEYFRERHHLSRHMTSHS